MKISHECAYCGAIYNVKTGTTKQHHKDIKCPFCEHEDVLLVNGDGGDYGEKKLNNYSKNVDKLHKKIDNQKNEITRLQDKLNVANGIVFKQINENKRLNDLLDDKELRLTNTIKQYEVSLALNEKTIKDQKVIREYLESKLFKGDE